MTVINVVSVLAWLPTTLDNYQVRFVQEGDMPVTGEPGRANGWDYIVNHDTKVVYL